MSWKIWASNSVSGFSIAAKSRPWSVWHFANANCFALLFRRQFGLRKEGRGKFAKVCRNYYVPCNLDLLPLLVDTALIARLFLLCTQEFSRFFSWKEVRKEVYCKNESLSILSGQRVSQTHVGNVVESLLFIQLGEFLALCPFPIRLRFFPDMSTTKLENGNPERMQKTSAKKIPAEKLPNWQRISVRTCLAHPFGTEPYFQWN